MRRRTAALLLALLLGVAGAIPAHAAEDHLPPAGDTPFGEGLEDRHGDIQPEIRAQLRARRRTVLSSELAGRIAELTVREGERFEAGQRLLALDCSLHEARRAQKRAAAQQAERELEIKHELDRLNAIGRLELEAAAATRAMAEAELAIAEVMVERCVVIAPFSGRVAELPVERHQFVAEGEELVAILDHTVLEVEMIVPSRWLTWLAPGNVFTVELDETGRAYPGSVTRLGARIDPVSQSIKVFGRIDGEHPKLLPGMSGRVVLPPPAPESTGSQDMS